MTSRMATVALQHNIALGARDRAQQVKSGALARYTPGAVSPRLYVRGLVQTCTDEAEAWLAEMSAKPLQRELQLHERITAAGGAAFVSSILVNPLDVVKTRMQAQATTKPRAPGELFSRAGIETRRWVLTNGMYTWPVRNPNEPPIYIHRPPLEKYRSTLDGLLQIVRKEGVRVLYRGMDLNLLVGVPMVCLYLPSYDALSGAFQSAGAGKLSPLLAGSAARTVAVLVTSPVELFKTRLQNSQAARTTPGKSSYLQVWQGLALHKQNGILGRVQTLWTGVGAHMLKDVPFAALYWSLLEPIKHELEKSELGNSRPESQVLLVNATAGAAAGGLASAATTPFDVIKTHTQTNQKEGAKPQGVVEGLLCILRKRGATALFAGWAPRAIRTAVAYSILMGAYEQCKHICASGSGILPRLPAMHVPSPTDASKTS